MAYENLEDGVYPARLVSWSLRMNERLNQPQIELGFEFTTPSGDSESMRFTSFLYTKGGELNKKTLKTLEVIEFSGGTVADLNKQGTVNNEKDYTVTVKKSETTGYWNIEWVNDPATAPVGSAASTDLGGFNFSQFDGALKGMKRQAPQAMSHTVKPAPKPAAKPPVKNYAQNIGKGTAANDDDSEIPF